MKELFILMAIGGLTSAAYEGFKRITPIQRKLNTATIRNATAAGLKHNTQDFLVELMEAERNAAERFGVESQPTC